VLRWTEKPDTKNKINTSEFRLQRKSEMPKSSGKAITYFVEKYIYKNIKNSKAKTNKEVFIERKNKK